MFLGVDGGQSGTTALIGDENGRVVAIGRAGPYSDPAGALKALANSVREAGFQPGFHFRAACIGLSGGPQERAREVILADHYFITHDAMIALAGATGGDSGVIVIAGTGSIAFGRNAAGRTARAGGWGYIFGDEGGAFDLVRQALRAILRQEEGWGPPTALKELLLGASGAADANDLLHRLYTDEYPRARIASFAPLVGEAAQSGDMVAGDILKGAAQSLALCAAAVRRQLFRPAENVFLSYTGGVFRNPVVLERFRMLAELEEGNQVSAPRYGPASGALLEAYRIAGIRCTLSHVPPEK